MRIALCNEIFQLPWNKCLALIAQLGFEGVEIAPYTLTPDVRQISRRARAELLEEAQRYSLKIVGLHWLLVSPPDLHLTHPDPVVRERTVKYLGDLANFCADLGGRVMVLGSPRQRSTLPG